MRGRVGGIGDKLLSFSTSTTSTNTTDNNKKILNWI